MTVAYLKGKYSSPATSRTRRDSIRSELGNNDVSTADDVQWPGL